MKKSKFGGVLFAGLMFGMVIGYIILCAKYC